MTTDRQSRPRTAPEFLCLAARIVERRAKTHGDPLANHANIAELWNAYLRIRRTGAATRLTPEDVAVMLALLKLARMHTGEFNPDDDLDFAGYVGVAAEIRAAQRGKK